MLVDAARATATATALLVKFSEVAQARSTAKDQTTKSSDHDNEQERRFTYDGPNIIRVPNSRT